MKFSGSSSPKTCSKDKRSAQSAVTAVPLTLACGLLSACGGSEPLPQTPTAGPTAVAPAPRHKRSGMSMTGQLGSLDQQKVDDTFTRLMTRFNGCLSQGASRVEFLGGHVKFFVRIALDGTTRWAYLSESTIGDRDTENCMLDAAKAAHWPPPVEGEGQAEKAIDFDPSPDVRDAVPWGPDRIVRQLDAARPKLAQCTTGTHGRYKATAYVQTDGSVLAAGVAPPDERGEGSSDCLVEVIKGLKFPSPGSWPAKVTFDVD